MVFNLRRGCKRQELLSLTPPLLINANPLARTDTFQYLGVSVASNLTWSDHIIKLSHKIRRLSFALKRLKSVGTPKSSILTFLKACILPHVTYCSPVIFPGLLSKDFTILKRSIKLLSKCSSVPYSYLVSLIVDLHFRSCDHLAQRILTDVSHPLHSALFSQSPKRTTRGSFTCMLTRTSAFEIQLSHIYVVISLILQKLLMSLNVAFRRSC